MTQKLLTLLILPASIFAASALSGGVNGNGTLESAIPLEHKTLSVDGGFSYYPGEDLRLQSAPGGADRFDLAAAVNYGLYPFFEVGAFLPYYRDQDVQGNEYRGTGDLRTSFKLNYPPYPHRKGFEVSLLAQFTWPTATSAGETGGYNRSVWNTAISEGTPQTKNAFGAHGPVMVAKMLTTANFGASEKLIPLMLHLNWGAAFSGASSQNAFLLGGGAELNPIPSLTLFWSFNSEVPVTQASKSVPIFDYPFASAAGVQVNIPKAHVHVYGGVHFDLNDRPDVLYTPGRSADDAQSNYARYPGFGYFAGLSVDFALVAKDTDGDGILDQADKCPKEAEDFDKFEDEDGCPDLDNDQDGVPDAEDKCPDALEDKDGFEDTDGCPDEDNDKDGIADKKDKCPNEAEDFDGFEDEDGCPDLDNDKDGIPDTTDKCPLKAEDMDGFEDEDGCPDLDNDRDGIPDYLDKCPNQAEVVNGVEDGDGCPDSLPPLPPGAKVGTGK